MTSKLLSRTLRALSALLIVIAVAALMLSMLLKDLGYYTRLGLQNLEETTGYRLTFGRVSTHIGWWAGLRIDDFTLSHPATDRKFLSGEHIYLRIQLSRLLKKKIDIQELLIEKPQIQVYRDVDGTWHSFLSALFSPDANEVENAFGGYYVSARNIDLSGGTLEVRDEKQGRVLRLQDCDITLVRKDGGMLHTQLTAQHYAEGSRGTVRYTSEFHRSIFRRRGPNKKVPILLKGALDFSNMPMRECLSYLPPRFDMPFDGGLLDAALVFDVRHDRQVTARGEFLLTGAQLGLPGFEPVSLPDTRLSFRGGMNRSALSCSEFTLQLDPDVYLNGSFGLEGLDAEMPDFELRINAGRLNIGDIATRMTDADPGRFAWLAEAFKRMPAATASVSALDMSAALDGAYIPVTANLKAWVNLLKGDRHLIDFAMHPPGGKKRLDCTITSRLVSASIQDVLARLTDGKTRSMIAMQQGSIGIKTTVHLDDNLFITSAIDTTDAAYGISGLIGKPRGISNTIRLDYDQAKNPAVLPFEVSFDDTLNAGGHMLLADGFAVEGRFAAKDCTLQTFNFPFLPPALSLSGSVSGSGDFVFPSEEGLRPLGAALKLDGLALFMQPEDQPRMRVDAALEFSSGSGPISISDGHVIAGKTHGAFEGQLDSVMPLVGTFTAPMEYYDIGDFVELMLDIVRSAETKDTPPVVAEDDSPGMFAQMDISVDLTSKQTKYLDWHFGPGRSDFSIKNKQMFWDSVDIEAGNGTFNGSVLYDLSNSAHYRLEFVIDRTDVDVAWAIPAFRKKKTITGQLNLESRFSSNFKTSNELLRNMEGTFDFVVKDGKIEQMTLLSNILNTLNVAQLLAFKMPEYSAQGMPFDTLSGRFSLKELQLSTDDLHVKCPSMDFSVAGVFDFNVDELDLLVGVQIFRSVAKMLGSVPYFGKKITGKGKTFTVTYFKARGPFDKPEILPIPSRAIDNAILKIFKSVWEVPMDIVDLPRDMIRLFTEPEMDNATAQ